MRQRTKYEKLLYYLTVPKCVRCHKGLEIDDFGICKPCMADYENTLAFKCSSCFKQYKYCVCVNDYLDRHYVHKLIKIFPYKYEENGEVRAANHLIYNLKRNARRDIIAFLSEQFKESILESKIKYEDFVITSIPRSKTRRLKYGFDHSEKLARSLAKLLGIKYVKTIVSKSKKSQKSVRGEDKIKNVSFDYHHSAPDLTGKKIFILDDIVTTGASMGVAAMLLHGLGAKTIIGITIAVTFLDKQTHFQYVRPIR